MQTQQAQQQATAHSNQVVDATTSAPPAVEPQAPVANAPATAAPAATATTATKGAAQTDNAQQKPLADFNAFLGQVAHGMAYETGGLSEADQQFLTVNGYKANPVIQGKNAFVMRVFLPTEAGKPPIVAFRGTVTSEAQTILTDLDPAGIGVSQFTANQQVIQAQMDIAAAYGKVVVTGQSLGGALAQLAAATFPQDVEKIVTFQSPGVSSATVQKVVQWNQQHPGEPITSEHIRVQGDVVPLGGQALTPGTIDTYAMQNSSARADHAALPLAQMQQQQGETGLPYSSSTGNVSLVGTESTAQDNATKPQLVEDIRTGVGDVVFGGMAVGNAVGKAASAVGNAVGSAASAVGKAASSVAHKVEDWF